MGVRLLLFAFLAVLLSGAPAKKQTVGSGRGENEDMILSVTLYSAPPDVKELLGDDLGGHFMVADVKIEPKYGKTLNIDRDDFVLHTDENGDKAMPFAASQIAGREAIIVTQEGAKQSKSGISLGGMGGGLGSSPGTDAGTTKVKMQNPAAQKENPLEKTLQEKILVEQKADKPVSGLLYFPMEKQKLKDLEIRYGPKESRITLRFK